MWNKLASVGHQISAPHHRRARRPLWSRPTERTGLHTDNECQPTSLQQVSPASAAWRQNKTLSSTTLCCRCHQALPFLWVRRSPDPVAVPGPGGSHSEEVEVIAFKLLSLATHPLPPSALCVLDLPRRALLREKPGQGLSLYRLLSAHARSGLA